MIATDSYHVGYSGVAFFVLGLIFFFDRALLAMGNVLFLVGIGLLLGPARTFTFFARRQKWRGTTAFWAGVFLILARWTFIGFAVECVGIFYLFGEFFKVSNAGRYKVVFSQGL